MEKVWHPSKQKTNPRAGTATCLPHANADTTFNSLSNWDQVKKFRAGAVSLTTASQQSLSIETEDCLPASLPKIPRPRGKQYCANSTLQPAGSEDQSNGTFLWIMSTVSDNTSERETTALGHRQ